VQDTHTNRVTCVWSGDQLVRLTHSAGQFLELAYNGPRISSVTDSLGRQATFAYDGVNYTTTEPSLGHGSSPVTMEKTHTIPPLPIVGSVAVLGISLLLGTSAKKI